MSEQVLERALALVAGLDVELKRVAQELRANVERMKPDVKLPPAPDDDE